MRRLVLLMLMLLLCHPEHALAAAPGRAVIVVLDRMSVNDMMLMPHLVHLAARGGMGLMNDNTGGGLTLENSYLTIGAGSHARTGSPNQVFSAGESTAAGTAAQEYFRRTGKIPPAGAVLVLDIAQIRHFAAKLPYPCAPGELGEYLHRAGLQTCIIGSADIPTQASRMAAAMAMDREGVVDRGSLDVLKADSIFPGGVRCDYARLLQIFDREKADLTVIDPGDPDRLDDVRLTTDESIFNSRRKETLARLDEFLGRLAGRLDFKRDLLLLITPAPYRTDQTEPSLLPVCELGPGPGGGALTSPTTRRPGLITNMDIAPTILKFFGIPQPAEMIGRPVKQIRMHEPYARLVKLASDAGTVYRARPFLQRAYILSQFILLGLSLAAIGWRWQKTAGHICFFFLAVTAVPLVYLLITLLPFAGAVALGLELLLGTVFLAVLCNGLSRLTKMDPFIFLCLGTAGAILLDIVLGSPLEYRSVLSYDPIVGARYYGIGNEYMGVLIGTGVMGMSALAGRRPGSRPVKLLVCLFYALAIVLTGAPQLGANAGGGIATFLAFFTSAFLLMGIRFSKAVILVLGGGVLVFVFGLALFDFLRPAGLQSHIGLAVTQIITGGGQEIYRIVVRKQAVNYRLLRYTIWSRIFVATLLCLAFILYRPFSAMSRLREQNSTLFKGVAGVVVGAIAALLFNDSGVIAAATAMSFAVPPLIFTLLKPLREAR